MSADDRPPLWELQSVCSDCGEPLDHGREECVTLDCPRYLEVTNSLERECVLAHARDCRDLGYVGEDEKVAS